MNLTVIQNGKFRERGLIGLRDEYCHRFRRYGQLDVVERQPRGDDGIWPHNVHWRVLLDEHGEQPTSRELAALLADWSMRHGRIGFAVGAADGHDPATTAKADYRWALGRLTMPHQLAHLVVVEQLYRAGTILAGSGYHRD